MRLIFHSREEVDTCHEIIAQLEEERKSLNKKIDRLEREIKDERQTSNKANSKVTELQGRLSQVVLQQKAGYVGEISVAYCLFIHN